MTRREEKVKRCLLILAEAIEDGRITNLSEEIEQILDISCDNDGDEI